MFNKLRGMKKFNLMDIMTRDYDEDDEYDDDYEDDYDEYEPSHRVESRSQQQPPIYGLREVPERKKSRELDYDSHKRQLPATPQQRGVGQVHDFSRTQIRIARLNSFDEARSICEDIRNHKPVIVNLEDVEFPTAQRIMDFLCGAAFALDGTLERVATHIILFAPPNIDIAPDVRKEVKSKSYASPPWSNTSNR
ncbi:MAG: cell division protein SepF [Bacillota bacterium]